MKTQFSKSTPFNDKMVVRFKDLYIIPFSHFYKFTHTILNDEDLLEYIMTTDFQVIEYVDFVKSYSNNRNEYFDEITIRCISEYDENSNNMNIARDIVDSIDLYGMDSHITKKKMENVSKLNEASKSKMLEYLPRHQFILEYLFISNIVILAILFYILSIIIK